MAVFLLCPTRKTSRGEKEAGRVTKLRSIVPWRNININQCSCVVRTFIFDDPCIERKLLAFFKQDVPWISLELGCQIQSVLEQAKNLPWQIFALLHQNRACGFFFFFFFFFLLTLFFSLSAGPSILIQPISCLGIFPLGTPLRLVPVVLITNFYSPATTSPFASRSTHISHPAGLKEALQSVSFGLAGFFGGVEIQAHLRSRVLVKYPCLGVRQLLTSVLVVDQRHGFKSGAYRAVKRTGDT